MSSLSGILRSRLLRLFWRAPRTRMASRRASVIPSPSRSLERRAGETRGARSDIVKDPSPCSASIPRRVCEYGDVRRRLQIPPAIQYRDHRSPVHGVAVRACEPRHAGVSARSVYHWRRPNVPNQGECRMSSRVLSGVALAAAAAVMFSTVAVSTASADEGKVKCEGVNSCKGHSACKSANNSCKGQNSCKGKGFLEMTQAQCDAAKAKAKAGG